MSWLSGCCLALAALTACHAPPKNTASLTWSTRGDAALASDPGRALANYEKAKSADGTRDPQLDDKIHQAARKWLLAEIDKRRAARSARPADDLAFAVDARAAADRYDLRHEVEPALAAIEEAAARSFWQQHVAQAGSPPRTPLEAIDYLEAVRAVLPTSTPSVIAEADQEIARRRVALFTRLEELHAKARASGHAGARLLHEMLIAALQHAPVPRASAREAVAAAARVTARAEVAGGCEVARQARFSLPTGGPHQVLIRIEGASCSASESRRDYQDTESWDDYETEEYTVEVPGDCPPVDPRTCITGTMGQCMSTPCLPKYEKRTRTKRVPRSTSWPVDERTLTGTITGTYVITVDGVVERRPLQLTVSRVEKEFRNPRTGATSSFTSRTAEDVLRRAGPDKLASAVRELATEIERTILQQTLMSAERKLASGDVYGAEHDLVVAAWGGLRTVPRTFEPLAAMAGMPFDAWSSILLDGSRPKPATIDAQLLAGTSGLSYGRPDEDLVNADLDAERIRRRMEDEQRKHRNVLATDNTPRSIIGVGMHRWLDMADSSSHGVTMLYARTRADGNQKIWFRDMAFILDVNSSLAVELDAHYRLGAGLRNPWLLGGVYAVGGVGRRGAKYSGMDVGMPLQLEVGIGAKLVLLPGKPKRLELLAERLSRPFADESAMPVPVLQRLHYELRYVSNHGFTGALGARGWCTFEQMSTEDLLVPSAPVAMRTCSIVGFLAY